MLQWFSQSFLRSVSYLQKLHLYFFPEVTVDEDVDGACWRWRDGAACFADRGGVLMGSMGVVMIKKLVQIFVMIGMVGKVGKV